LRYAVALAYLLTNLLELPAAYAEHGSLQLPSVHLSVPSFARCGLLLSAQQAENIDRDIAPSLSTFRQRLKTFMFQASFPDVITDPR